MYPTKIIKTFPLNCICTSQSQMFKNYIKVFIRNLLNAKLFATVNLTGLSIGMLAFMIIFHYVKYESSYDSFHEFKEQIFRITIQDKGEDGDLGDEFATISPAYGPLINAYFEEIEDYTRLVSTRPFMSKPALNVNQKTFFEDHLYYADQQFLNIFSFPLIQGDQNTALKNPNSIVLTRKLAQKYFGTDDAIQKTIRMAMGSRGEVELKVTGVLEDFPNNSHIHTDALISFNSLPSKWNLDQVLDWGDFYVYCKLASNISPHLVRNQLPVFLEATLGDYSKNAVLNMQNVAEIHLNSNKRHEIKPTGNEESLLFLFLIGILILVTAWINYVNLSQAKTIDYVKEFGLRKMMGASRTQLFSQILTNTLAINLMAFCIALTLAQLLLPVVYKFIQQPLEFGIFDDISLLIFVFLVVICGSVLSGVYPLMLMNKANLSDSSKGVINKSKRGVATKKTLLGFQLVMTAMLIAMTLTIYQQMDLLKHQKLGINIDQKIVLKGPPQKKQNYLSKAESFKAQVQNESSIAGVTVSTSIPGKELGWGRGMYPIGKSKDFDVPISIVAVDKNFFSLYDVNFLGGKNFESDLNPKSNHVIINQKAARELGFSTPTEAIGQQIAWSENDQEIVLMVIGVVDNFNQQSGKFIHQPIIFPLNTRLNAPWADEFYTVNLASSPTADILNLIENKWKEAFPDNPYEYFFLDNYYHQQYKSDEKFQFIFKAFTVLAIMISMLGLFGLINLTIVQRIKEIGIRKVLGASLNELIQLLLKEYLIITMIALALSIPIAYVLANIWLQEFALKVQIGYWFFIGPLVSLLTIIFFTLSFQVYRAASRNPVEALRYE